MKKKTKKKLQLITVTSSNNTDQTTLVLAEKIQDNIYHVSKIEADSAKRVLNIVKPNRLILANHLRKQGYIIYIS